MPTALLIERDRQYLLCRRRLRASCARGEWDDPRHRAAAIARAWKLGIENLQAQGEFELVMPAPVTLYCSPLDGSVVVVDLTLNPSQPRWITPLGDATRPPAAIGFYKAIPTSYLSWAEGPLPHLASTVVPTPPPLSREVERLRGQNSSLRAAIDRALGPTAAVGPALDVPEDTDLVDFRICGIFRRPDLRVLQSKQGAEDVAILAPDGSRLEVPKDGEALPEDLL